MELGVETENRLLGHREIRGERLKVAKLKVTREFQPLIQAGLLPTVVPPPPLGTTQVTGRWAYIGYDGTQIAADSRKQRDFFLENEGHHRSILDVGVPKHQRHHGLTRAEDTGKYLKHNLKSDLSTFCTEMSRLKSFFKH